MRREDTLSSAERKKFAERGRRCIGKVKRNLQDSGSFWLDDSIAAIFSMATLLLQQLSVQLIEAAGNRDDDQIR